MVNGRGSIPHFNQITYLINNLLILTGVPVYWQGLVAGLVLIVAVGFDEYSKRRRGEVRS